MVSLSKFGAKECGTTLGAETLAMMDLAGTCDLVTAIVLQANRNS